VSRVSGSMPMPRGSASTGLRPRVADRRCRHLGRRPASAIAASRRAPPHRRRAFCVVPQEGGDDIRSPRGRSRSSTDGRARSNRPHPPSTSLITVFRPRSPSRGRYQRALQHWFPSSVAGTVGLRKNIVQSDYMINILLSSTRTAAPERRRNAMTIWRQARTPRRRGEASSRMRSKPTQAPFQ